MNPAPAESDKSTDSKNRQDSATASYDKAIGYSMKLGLNIRQSLKLAPQLIQSLKMLQMPVLKLEQTIRHELAINPLLEEIEELEAPETDEAEETKEESEDDSTVDWDEYLFDDEEGYKVREVREAPETTFEGVSAQVTNLYTHMGDQLSLLKLTEGDHLIGEYIIRNISPDGYLTISVAEMAD